MMPGEWQSLWDTSSGDHNCLRKISEKQKKNFQKLWTTNKAMLLAVKEIRQKKCSETNIFKITLLVVLKEFRVYTDTDIKKRNSITLFFK